MLRLRLDTRIGAEINVLFALDNMRKAMNKTYYVRDDQDDAMLYTQKRRLIGRIEVLLKQRGDIEEKDTVDRIELNTSTDNSKVGYFEVWNSQWNQLIQLEFILMDKEQHGEYVDGMLRNDLNNEVKPIFVI